MTDAGSDGRPPVHEAEFGPLRRVPDEYCLLEAVQRVARMLLIERPTQADELITIEPDVSDVLLAGNGAVRLEHPDGASGYIVATDGSRRTYDELPRGYTGPVKTVHLRPPGPVLGPLFHRLVARLSEKSERLYASPVVQRMISCIDSYGQLSVEAADGLWAGQALPHDLDVRRSVTNEQARDWASRAELQLTQAFLNMHVAGSAAIPAYAAITLLAHCPVAGTLCDAVVRYTGVLTLDPESLIRVLYSAEGLAYVRAVANTMQDLGDDLRREADRRTNFVQFHQNLHRSYLLYVSALQLFNVLLGDALRVWQPRSELLEETRARRDACEEMRVIIVNAFAVSTLDRPRSPNITEPEQWENWLACLRHLPLPDALNCVDDYYLRLTFPRLCRDIAGACLRLDHAPGDARELASAVATARRLELTPEQRGSGLFAAQVESLITRIAQEYRRQGDQAEGERWS